MTTNASCQSGSSDFGRMRNSRVDTGDAVGQILHARMVKEQFRALPALSGTNPECDVIRACLDSFQDHAAAPEAHSRAKHQGCSVFGLRNASSQRRRPRWFCTRQRRRASNRKEHIAPLSLNSPVPGEELKRTA